MKMSLEEKHKNVIEILTAEINDKEKGYVDTSTLAVVLNWLTLLSNKNLDWSNLNSDSGIQ